MPDHRANHRSPGQDPFSFKSQDSESRFGTLLDAKSTVDDFEASGHRSDLTISSPSAIDASISLMKFDESMVSLPNGTPNGNHDDTFQLDASFRSNASQPNSPRPYHPPTEKNNTLELSYEWKVLLLGLVDVLAWKKRWYPGVIFAVNSLFFVEVWRCQLSFLSLLSVVGFMIASVDFLLPFVLPVFTATAPGLFSADLNTDRLVGLFTPWYYLLDKCVLMAAQATVLRLQMPRVFSMILAFVFLLTAWVFAKVSLLFMAYVVSTAALLAPGVMENGVTNTVTGLLQPVLARIRGQQQPLHQKVQ